MLQSSRIKKVEGDIMLKGYKFRIYPTHEQKILIHKSFGCARFVYNYYLTKIKDGNYKSAFVCVKDYVDHLKYEYSFLQEVDSIIIRKSLFHLEEAFKRYFNHIAEYPKYKSKWSRNSYTTSAIYRNYKEKTYCNIEVDLQKKQIKLPKLKWIKCRGYRNLDKINARIINTTISKESNGKYYVSILYDLPISEKKQKIPNSIVGIDLGVKNLMTLSDNTVIENNRYVLKYEKRIKRCQKELARKEKQSKNYYKCKQKLATLYSKLKNARNYYLHHITKKITDNYDIIVCEKLHTKDMLARKVLSKHISDASFYEITRQLQYKSNWKRKLFYQINDYYPSSQTCSICGTVDKKYKNLLEREYQCCNCQNVMDRDLNASINIMFGCLKLYMKTCLE